MHDLISKLFIFTTFQFIIAATAWATMLFGLIFGLVYSNTHKFDDKNWTYYFIIISPFIISSALAIYVSIDINNARTTVNDPTIKNYTLTRNNNTLTFVSKNKNLKSANLNIVSENNEYLYLKYGNEIIDIRKDELQLDKIRTVKRYD